jgi:hypothetical protein
LLHEARTEPGADSAPEGGFDRFLRIPFTQPPEVLADAIARVAGAWRETLAAPASPRPAMGGRWTTALVS